MDNADAKQPALDKFEAFAEQKRQEAPEGLKHLNQVAPLAWPWMPSERAFVTSAMQGMGISITFAFIILLIATHNIILAIVSIFSVGMVIISVVCLMHLQGW